MEKEQKKHTNKRKKLIWILFFEIIILFGVFVVYRFVIPNSKQNNQTPNENSQNNGDNIEDEVDDPYEGLSQKEREALEEQERLRQEEQERLDLIAQADRFTLSYDYEGAIELIQSYEGAEGGYEVYTTLVSTIERYKAEQDTLLLYGGSYTSPTQFNHIFFHSLIADNSKAFDGDYDETGYNMYMTTVSEFKKMMQQMYEDGYVLVSIHDAVKEVTQEDGSTKFVPGEIYLPEGKKPFVLSQDDVNYYEYMEGDGFASRIVIGEDGIATTEMILDDGTVQTGPYDIVPIIDEFVEEHPDFSYRGAKGILAVTGYEGALGYRTNDPTSPTYEEDKETVKKVAEALKANGWEFASHSWGHKNSETISTEWFIRDSQRWLDEVEPLIGPTDIYIFPFGIDFENTMGHYKSEKYKFLKENGFNYFCGVFKEPWMHIKDDYVRMTRRPLDGQAMIQFPERLADLFDLDQIIDPDRPARDW